MNTLGSSTSFPPWLQVQWKLGLPLYLWQSPSRTAPATARGRASRARWCQTLKQRMTLAQTFLDRDLQQDHEQGLSEEITTEGQSRREGEWEWPLWSSKVLLVSTHNGSPRAPRNSWWNWRNERSSTGFTVGRIKAWKYVKWPHFTLRMVWLENRKFKKPSKGSRVVLCRRQRGAMTYVFSLCYATEYHTLERSLRFLIHTLEC